MYKGFKCEKKNNEGKIKEIIGGRVNEIKEFAYSIIKSTIQKAPDIVGKNGLKVANEVANYYLSKTVSKFIGAGFIFGGAIIGATLGGYITVSYCEELLARFEDYYKKNANKIANSYDEAKNYFILDFV